MKVSNVVLGEYLTNIINLSLELGEVPAILKTSVITPVPKVPRAIDGENFRPINVLPIIEKILETVVKDQLMNFFETNNIFTTQQSGFRRHHSCETAIQLVLEDLREKIGSTITVAVFLDLRKAFETIDRDILLQKLERYGIRGKVAKWIKSYLTYRTQKVKYNGWYSGTLDNNIGVPQGSKLGPLLFIIYINDIANNLQFVTIHLYADDALILISGIKIQEVLEKLKVDINVMEMWLEVNKMKPNLEKTKAMLIGSPKMRKMVGNIEIKIGGEKIEIVDKIKHLGIMLDHELTFKQHGQYVIKKMAKKVGLFLRIHLSLPMEAKIMLYKAIIAPHIDYCSSLLFLLGQNEIMTLQKLQNKVMRGILKVNRTTSINKMCKALGWMQIKERILLNTLSFIHKTYKGIMPQYLGDKLTKVETVHKYHTRGSMNLNVNRINRRKEENSIFVKGIKIFNRIPIEIRNEDNPKRFRVECNKLIKNCKLMAKSYERRNFWDK